MRVVKPWHRLPREVVGAPSLEAFQARLDGALSNLMWVKMSLLMAGGLDQMTFKGPFLPKPSRDSLKSWRVELAEVEAVVHSHSSLLSERFMPSLSTCTTRVSTGPPGCIRSHPAPSDPTHRGTTHANASSSPSPLHG